MKVVIATPLYPPEIGGPATDAQALAERLSVQGHTVAIVRFSQVRDIPRVLRHVWYLVLLYRAARRADAIVAFDTVSVGVPAALAARIQGVPLVVRVPGDYAWEQGRQRFGVTDDFAVFQHARYGVRVEFLRTLQRFVVRQARLVLVPSEYMLKPVAGWGVSAKRLRRVYLGLPAVSDVAPMPSYGARILFSAGRFVPWKGFPLLIQLLAHLPDWKLVIAGDGPERASLEALAQTIGVSGRVIFLGSVDHRVVLSHLRHADAFVYNTSWESFSFQVLEAMQAGAAIITTRVGSLPELIEDKRDGVLLAPDDLDGFLAAVQSLEDEPLEWSARRTAARERASMFSIESSTDALVQAIQSVCESSS